MTRKVKRRRVEETIFSVSIAATFCCFARRKLKPNRVQNFFKSTVCSNYAGELEARASEIEISLK